MNLGRFDLNLLRSLDALLRERNVTRAAEQLCLTQQAMSGALARLRAHFGDELLVRVGRQLEPTPLACALEQPVREALLRVQSALDTVPSFDPALARHSFRIAMTDYASHVLLPALLRQLAREAPHMRCHVEGLDAASFHRLDAGDLDFCVAADDCRLYGSHRPSPETRTAALFEDEFVCAVSSDHPDVSDTLSRDQYQRLPHNTVRMGRGIATLVELGWKRAGLELNVAATAPSFSSLLFMLPHTPLIATAQRRLVEVFRAPLSLRIVDCPIAIDGLRELLFWHARNELDPRHQYFRNALVRASAADTRTPPTAAPGVRKGSAATTELLEHA